MTGSFLPLFSIIYRAIFSMHVHCTVITCIFGTINTQWTRLVDVGTTDASNSCFGTLLGLEEPGNQYILSAGLENAPKSITSCMVIIWALSKVLISSYSTLKQFTPYWLIDQKTTFAFSCDLTIVESGDWPRFPVLDVSTMSFSLQDRKRSCLWRIKSISSISTYNIHILHIYLPVHGHVVAQYRHTQARQAIPELCNPSRREAKDLVL